MSKVGKAIDIEEMILNFKPYSIVGNQMKLREKLKGSDIFDEFADEIRIPITDIRKMEYDITNRKLEIQF